MRCKPFGLGPQGLRTTIINLLKTGGVELLDYCREDGTTARDGSQQAEIGRLPMPWPEWVATWETDSDAPDDPAWDRLAVIG